MSFSTLKSSGLYICYKAIIHNLHGMCEQCLWRAALLERSWGDVPKFLSAVDLSTVQNTKHRGTHREFAWGSCVPQSLNSYRLLHSKQASYHAFTNAWYGYTWAATRTPTCMHMQATTVQKTQTYPTATVTCIQTLTPNATNTSNACCIPYSVHIRTWHTGYNWLQVLHVYVPDRQSTRDNISAIHMWPEECGVTCVKWWAISVYSYICTHMGL